MKTQKTIIALFAAALTIASLSACNQKSGEQADAQSAQIAELTKKGYRPFKEIQYYEMPGGKHDTETWAQAMPEFLKWAFGK